MNPPKRLIILGATGSIGSTVLSEIHPFLDQFQVVGVSCYSRIEHLKDIISQFSPQAITVVNSSIRVNFNFDGKIFYGIDGLTQMVDALDFDILVVAVSGISGLKATLRAIERGKTIILANKEILIVAGSMVMNTAREKGSLILPLDSEHNAIFQCLRNDYRLIKNLWLTSSGGKFWNQDPKVIQNATVEEVLQHPKWSMGQKITVDSSTMANKGLEIIEAMHLFHVNETQIKILIHPECIIHSLVEFCDGNFLAQMSPTSMKYATRHCLFYPERVAIQESSLDLFQLGSLHFKHPNFEQFPCLRLAMTVAQDKQSRHIAFNAANETAVRLFLERKIAFGLIPQLIEENLSTVKSESCATIEEILAIDGEVRHQTQQLAKNFYI